MFGILPEGWRDVFTKQAVQTETICQGQMRKVDSREIASIKSVPNWEQCEQVIVSYNILNKFIFLSIPSLVSKPGVSDAKEKL